MLIAVEGTNGAGKTTVIDRLKKEYPDFIYLKEGIGEYHSRSDRFIKIMARRSELVHSITLPALKEGKTVIMDRFCLSTLAYNGYAEFQPYSNNPDKDLAEHLEFVQKVSNMASAGLEPNLHIYISTPLMVVMNRRPNMSIDFVKKVQFGYRQAINNSVSRILTVNGMRSKENVFLQVVGALEMVGCLKRGEYDWSR